MYKKYIYLPALFLLPWILSGATYYVSPQGNDGNSGLSPGNAFRTLQQSAITVVAGDSVFVADSTYAGFDIRTSGTAADPIVFLALGSQVIINRRNPVTTDGINIEDADWIEIRGFQVINQPRAGIRAVNADHITIRDNTCLNNFKWGIFTGFTDDFLAEYNECANSTDEHGIYVSNSSDRAIIRYNISHHNRAAGLHFNGDISQGEDGINHDPQVYGNILYRNGLGGGAAINMDGNQNALIYNNLIYDNYATGIALYQIDGGGPSINARIYHNTIVQDPSARWCILLTDGASGATLRNNILINRHSFRGIINIDPASRTGFSSDYNVTTNWFTLDDGNSVLDSSAWKALGYDTHSFFSANLTNLFINYPGEDLHLAPGAKAINFGITTLSPDVATDLEGKLRTTGGAPDAGAYESVSGALPLFWTHVSIRRESHLIEIRGTLETDERAEKIILEEWNQRTEAFTVRDSRTVSIAHGTLKTGFSLPASAGWHRYRLHAQNASGNKITSPEIYIQVPTEDWSIFPNPTAGLIFLRLPDLDNASLVVRDAMGRTIRWIGNTREPVNLHGLPPGKYLLTLMQDIHTLGQKWILKAGD
ncbi:MAG TPA: right-handed parallel beta-helix repeat-containing protein [Saprospiraceae bacterium]|nr:right-handed parallel beta-helix repeat-containing protein [Saprospiraceae bacterium]HNT19860.1 right-handed parallel beta-helix repeat-containing protein [Saprospiraceae bacterium]